MPIVQTVTPATRRMLSTIGRYRDAMPEADVSDEVLERMIAQASAWIERRCGRVFARERVIEETWGSGLRVLLLTRTPVVSVHGVSLDDEAVLVDRYALSAPETGLLRFVATGASFEDWWEELGGPRLYDRRGLLSGSASRSYRVEYTGGYILPSDDGDDEPTLPEDVERACMLIVRGDIEARLRPVGVTSERLGDASWTYGEGGAARAEAAKMLDHYRTPVL